MTLSSSSQMRVSHHDIETSFLSMFPYKQTLEHRPKLIINCRQDPNPVGVPNHFLAPVLGAPEFTLPSMIV